jgi:hypothetical protein
MPCDHELARLDTHAPERSSRQNCKIKRNKPPSVCKAESQQSRYASVYSWLHGEFKRGLKGECDVSRTEQGRGRAKTIALSFQS